METRHRPESFGLIGQSCSSCAAHGDYSFFNLLARIIHRIVALSSLSLFDPLQNKCDLAKDPSIPSGDELRQFVTEHKFVQPL